MHRGIVLFPEVVVYRGCIQWYSEVVFCREVSFLRGCCVQGAYQRLLCTGSISEVVVYKEHIRGCCVQLGAYQKLSFVERFLECPL